MFQIIKTAGGHVTNNGVASLQDMLNTVRDHSGWNSLEEMHDHISTWAARAKIGDVFTTQNVAIVYAGVRGSDVCPTCEESLDVSYGCFTSGEHGIEQLGQCKHCEASWKDTFVLSRRQIQPPAAKHQAVGTREKPTKKKK